MLSCKMLSKGTGVRSSVKPNPKRSAIRFLGMHEDILNVSDHVQRGLSR